MRQPAIVLALVLGLLAAAGCGGDNEPETAATTEWANDLCSAVTTWTQDLQATIDELSNLSSFSGEGLREATSDFEESTERFVEEVRALGAPDTEAGAEARDAVESLADTIQAEREEIEAAVEDASGVAGIASAASAVGASLSAMSEAFGQTFERLEGVDATGELEQAFEDAEACDELASS